MGRASRQSIGMPFISSSAAAQQATAIGVDVRRLRARTPNAAKKREDQNDDDAGAARRDAAARTLGIVLNRSV